MVGDQRFTKPGTVATDLDAAWRDRLDDAEILLASNRNASAIVMGLYTLEIYLKARICRRLDVQHLPRAFEIHDLDGLLLLAGLTRKMSSKRSSQVKSNWNYIVRTSDRLNEMRYSPNARWSPADAATFFAQLKGTPDGVLPLATEAEMIGDPRMLSDLRRISGAIQKYAHFAGWKRDDYRVFVRPEMDWGQIHLVLAAREFPDGNNPWFSVMHFLEKELKGEPELLDSISLTVSTFSQIQAGGIHGLSDNYVELQDQISAGSAG